MRHIVDPNQQRMFSPFDGLLSDVAWREIETGWQGVFRHVVLELMPVTELGRHFDPQMGAPTKELYSMAGLVFLADFHGWTAAEATNAYLFHLDVQYALNVDPGGSLSSRTLERYQARFRNDELAAGVFQKVTLRLAEKLELDISKQRLDSTHVFSHMANFGRTKLMAITVKRFLAQVQAQAPQLYDALPADLRKRYETAESQLFSGSKDTAARLQSRQQAAEDLLWVIEHFADHRKLVKTELYQVLLRVFAEQCEIVEEGQVAVRKHTGGNCMQNPSDRDATYDGKKGVGYKVQLSETCGETNDVQLITSALPQTACERDEQSLIPMLEQLAAEGLLPEELLADAAYGSDGNAQAAAALNVELVAPVAGCPLKAPLELSIDDFALDERTGMIEACPQGHAPLSVIRDEEVGHTTVEMPAATCQACPFRAECPIGEARGRFVIGFTDKEQRTAGRRREIETDVFQERYANRSGIESTNSGLKNRLGLKRLRVRGRGSVFRAILFKLAGWNILRAAASKKLRAWISRMIAGTLKSNDSAHSGKNLAFPIFAYKCFHDLCMPPVAVRDDSASKLRLISL